MSRTRPLGDHLSGSDESESPIIETSDLTKSYGDVTAVDGVSLKIRQGEVFGLLGPNGAGKSTIFDLLLGLTTPTAGRPYWDGIHRMGHSPRRMESGCWPKIPECTCD